MALSSELNALEGFSIRKEDGVEKAAFLVAQCKDPEIRKQAVAVAVRCTRHDETSALEFLAWLLVYKVVPPIQVLQGILYTSNSEVLNICGTKSFEQDSLEYMGLSETSGKVPQYRAAATNGTTFVDFLSVEVDEDARETAVEEGTEDSIAAALAIKSREDKLAELKGRVRGIVMSSMSAEEIAHKILGAIPKKAHREATGALLQTCWEEKTYDRIYGNVSIKLSRRTQQWAEAFQWHFAHIFTEEAEDLDASQLNIAGTFFGHLLSANAVNWASVFGATSLDPEESTPSNRIFLQALLRELRQEAGTSSLQQRLMSDELREATRRLFMGEFAAQFWDVTAFPMLAEQVYIDNSS